MSEEKEVELIEDRLGELSEEYDLAENLKDRKWRINHLYYVKNEKGEKVRFVMNAVQEFILDNLWYLNVILKARQLGVTTFISILNLDGCLFEGLDVGFIAQTAKDAEEIFDNKIKFAWDNLPETIKALFIIDADSAKNLKFKNKVTGKTSEVYVGISLRGHTFQRIHISELSTIDQKDPLRAEEIRSGTFNSIHLGQIITVESTMKSNEGLFAEICQQALDNKNMGVQSEMDWKLFFFPWWQHPKYQLNGNNFQITKVYNDYFDKLEKNDGIILNNKQKLWYYKKALTQKDAMFREFPSTPEECFKASIEGAYFARETDRVIREGRLRSVPYDSRYPVDTWWDLGTTTTRKDSMSVTFTQIVGPEIRVIDFYGCSGEGLPYLKNILNDKGYTYGTHWAPHDIEVKEVGSGKTRLEMAADLGIRFRVVPKLPFNDGIEAVRSIMGRCWFDKEKTTGGGDMNKKSLFDALRAYRKEWDDRLGRYKDSPLKDWTSDPVDSFRMLAIGIQENNLLVDKETQELLEEKNNKSNNYDPLDPLGLNI